MNDKIKNIIIVILIILIIIGLMYFYFIPQYNQSICLKCYNQGINEEIIKINQNGNIPVIINNTIKEIPLKQLCTN